MISKDKPSRNKITTLLYERFNQFRTVQDQLNKSIVHDGIKRARRNLKIKIAKEISEEKDKLDYFFKHDSSIAHAVNLNTMLVKTMDYPGDMQYETISPLLTKQNKLIKLEERRISRNMELSEKFSPLAKLSRKAKQRLHDISSDSRFGRATVS